MKSKKIYLSVGAVLIALVIVAVALRKVGSQGDTHPNILFITFDTTRADRIGAYGYDRARTPVVDGLAAEGILFRHPSATVPLTLPSHTSMMTGLYPFYNGVRDNSHFALNPAADTLAEVLSAAGYQTAAVVAAFVLDSRFGLDQGFDDYRDELPDRGPTERFHIPERNAQKIVDDALDWLQGIDQDRPYFLWCHFYDPHHPYRTPTSFPYFLSHPYDQELAFADFHLQRLMDFLSEQPPNERPTMIVFAGDHGEGFGENGEETHGYFVYDGTIRVPLIIKMPDGSHPGLQVDTPVSLVDIMPTVLDVAGVPVPGEEQIHGRSLLPLCSGAPEVVQAFEERAVYFECNSPMYNLGFAPIRGVRVNQEKFIDSPIPEFYQLTEDPREGPRRNVFTTQQERAAEVTDKLYALLDKPLTSPALSSEEHSLDLDVIQKLRSLGYLAVEAAIDKEWGPEDDLKRMLPVYNRVLAASDTIGTGDAERGTEMLLSILTDYPHNPRALWLLAEVVASEPDATADGLTELKKAAFDPQLDVAMRVPFIINCGRAYLKKRDPEQALQFFQQAVDLEPENAINQMWAAGTLLTLDQPAAAVEMGEQACQLQPKSVPFQVFLGLAHFCNSQIQEGARVWDELLQQTPNLTIWEVASISTRDKGIAFRALEPLNEAVASPTIPPRVSAALHATNGQILMAAGQFEFALKAFLAASNLIDGDDALGLWWRARALIYLQRWAEAKGILERAYEMDPADIRIVADLATVHQQLGQPDQAIQLLSAYYDLHPEDSTAANNLAWVLSEFGDGEADLDRALELAKYAVKMTAGSASFHDTLGWIHLKRGDGESAIPAFSRAAKMQPENAEIHYHLGLALRLDEQPEAAREAFQQAVELAPTPRPEWLSEAEAAVGETADEPEPSID